MVASEGRIPCLDDLETAIIAAADQIATRGREEKWPTDRVWTEQLLRQLANVGHEQHFYVCGKGSALFGQGEWVYDLVWLKLENETHGDLLDAPLILESEWSVNLKDVEEDFYKLLIGRARHRVMVFQQKNADVLKSISTRLRDIVLKFEGTKEGDRYLFIGLSWAEQKFKAESFVA
jgi:hypothetical protein